MIILYIYIHLHMYIVYTMIFSSMARGAQLMDAGFINFLPGTHVEVNISMGYKDEQSWPQMTSGPPGTHF